MRAIILCKAPVAGLVKTRLMPHYTAEEAANIHQKMVDTVLRKVTSVFEDVWLASDDIHHAFFEKMKLKYHFNLCFQGEGDLGDRITYLMHASFEQDQSNVMFLGTDSPHVHINRYKQAVTAIENSDVVIGPVEDGGYDLIVIKQLVDSIFKGITWGSDQVFQQTLSACKQHRLQVSVLNSSFDLDDADDVKRAPIVSWETQS